MTTVVEIRGKRENEASDISKADEQINEVIHAKRYVHISTLHPHRSVANKRHK